MPLPLLGAAILARFAAGRLAGMAATGAKAFGVGAAFQIGGSVADISGLVSPFNREKAYAGNALLPNVMPEVSAIIHMLRAGMLSDTDAKQLAAWQGVDLNGFISGKNTDSIQKAWSNVAELQLTIPDIATVMELQRKGLFEDNTLANELYAKNGFDPKYFSQVYASMDYRLDFQLLMELRNRGVIDQDEFMDRLQKGGVVSEAERDFLNELRHEKFTANESITAVNRGFISEEDFTAKLEASGYTTEDSDVIKRLRFQPLGLIDLIQSVNRGLIAPEEFSEGLKVFGFDEKEQETFKRLRFQPPVISDLMRFMVKEAFDPATVKALGYDEEYPKDVIEPVALALGYRNLSDAIDGIPPKLDENIAKLHWRSHWQPISPTMAYTMRHRIRPYNIERGAFPGLNVKEFKAEDVNRWLRISDYPSGIRDYLMAISYGVLRLVDIRSLITGGVWGKTEVYNALLDRGLSPPDATSVTTLYVDKYGPESAEHNKPILAELLRSYKIGALGKIDARESYVNTVSESQEGRIAAGKKFDRLAKAIDVKQSNDNIQRAINALKGDFLEGAITEDEATIGLRNMGIAYPRIQGYIDWWGIDLTRPRRITSTQKVQAWYCDGLITRQEAERRLTNLGWSDADRLLYLTESDRCVSEKNAKAAMHAAKTEEQRGREIDKAMTRQSKEAQRIYNEWKKINTPARLGQWYRDESISEDEARGRLDKQGWERADIDRWVSQQTAPKTPTVVAGEGI